MQKLLLSVLLVLSAAFPSELHAHAVGEDYVFLNFRESSIDGLFEIHFDDLREKLDIDLGDPESAQGQLDVTATRVQDFIRENFDIGPVGAAEYDLDFTHQTITVLPQGAFAQYHFRAETGPLPDELALRHAMLYEGDRLHRGLVLVEYNAKTDTTYPDEYTAMVFRPGNEEQTLDLTDIPAILSPRDMVYQGMLHIWIGIDHILFLLALMLPTVLKREDGKWKAVESFPKALWNLLAIVTVFTIAHSATLLLAALDFVSVPSRLVESVIALSIVLVALNNITGRVKEGSLFIILGLGLFHGLGFASVMGHLPFRMVDLLKTVVGFNIGVELGQIAIVAIIFPLLYLLSRRELYESVVLKAGSAVLILISGWWFVQRAFEIG